MNRRQKVPVLMYHSIPDGHGEELTCMELAGMTVCVDHFRAQMDYIARHRNTISLHDFLAWRFDGRPLPPKPCMITFDDGFLDNYENALPILKERGIDAAFFIIGKCMVTSEPAWVHELHAIFDSATPAECASALPEVFSNVSGTEQIDKISLMSRSNELFNFVSRDKREVLLNRLRIEFQDQTRRNHIRYMNASHVAQLVEMGFDVGCHSMRHENLTSLTDKELEQEVQDSRNVIADTIGSVPEAFCYPFGGPRSYDGRVMSAVEDTGFTCAFTSGGGLNDRDTDRFALHRIHVTEMPISEFGARIRGRPRHLTRLKTIAAKVRRLV